MSYAYAYSFASASTYTTQASAYSYAYASGGSATSYAYASTSSYSYNNSWGVTGSWWPSCPGIGWTWNPWSCTWDPPVTYCPPVTPTPVNDCGCSPTTTPLTRTGTNGADVLYGGYGNDTLSGGFGNDKLFGCDGDDLLDGGAGDDTIYGGNGNDRIFGKAGNDLLYGGAGNDQIQAESGNDVVYGDDGNDTLWSGSGIDKLYGGNGNDLLYANSEDIVINGGAGYDTVDAASRTQGLTLNSYASTQIEKFIGSQGNDYVNLSDATVALTLIGNAGNDTLIGGRGNDSLEGNGGNDVLRGGAGNDTLIGNGGGDWLYGGTGNDTYRFWTKTSTDHILDEGGTDTYLVSEAQAPRNMALFRSGNDLQLSFRGTTDLVVFKNHFLAANRIENIRFANTRFASAVITAGEVNQILGQMAAYAANNGIALTSIDVVKANDPLLQIVNSFA